MGKKLPRMTSGDGQKPHPIRLYSQGQENGFYSKGNEKPKWGIQPGRPTACFALCGVFLDDPSCCVWSEPGRSIMCLAVSGQRQVVLPLS